MHDNDKRNALLSAISHGESRLTELNKERHNILAELKSHKDAALFVFFNKPLKFGNFPSRNRDGCATSSKSLNI